MALPVLNPLVVVKASMEFKVTNGPLQLFDSTPISFVLGNVFTQDFGDLFDLPAGTVDMPITMEGLTSAAMIFFMSNDPLQIKLVPQGALVGNTQPLTLYPGYPSLLCLQNIVGIYVSNPTAQVSKILIHGVGLNT